MPVPANSHIYSDVSFFNSGFLVQGQSYTLTIDKTRASIPLLASRSDGHAWHCNRCTEGLITASNMMRQVGKPFVSSECSMVLHGYFSQAKKLHDITKNSSIDACANM